MHCQHHDHIIERSNLCDGEINFNRKYAVSKCAECFLEVAKEKWYHWWGYNHDGYDTLSEHYDDYLVQEEEYVLDFLKESSYL